MKLGVKLFNRTSRGTELTPAGAYLKIEASRLLSMATSIQDLIRKIGESGTPLRPYRLCGVGDAVLPARVVGGNSGRDFPN